MTKSTEFIDYGFKPGLRNLLSTKVGRKSINTACLLEMPEYGTPAPSLSGHKTAIWLGSAVNAYKESPVMALVVEKGERARSLTSRWFVGIVPVAELVIADEIIDSIAPRAAYALQAAHHAVLPTEMQRDNISASASDAVDLLRAMYLR